MPKFRAGAFDKGSRQKGQYVVVEADSPAQAMLDVRKWFEGTPIQRIFATPAEPWDKVTSLKQHFTARPTRGSQ